jgi:hypothetical protein
LAEVRYKFGFPINQAKDDGEEDCEVPVELARLLEHEEREFQPHKEPMEVINLGSDEVKREVKIGASLTEHVHSELGKILREYVDIFSCFIKIYLV